MMDFLYQNKKMLGIVLALFLIGGYVLSLKSEINSLESDKNKIIRQYNEEVSAHQSCSEAFDATIKVNGEQNQTIVTLINEKNICYQKITEIRLNKNEQIERVKNMLKECLNKPEKVLTSEIKVDNCKINVVDENSTLLETLKGIGK